MSAGPAYTIVRIKRKATEPPLSSLVIQDGLAGFGTPKKRRDVSGRPRGVFRLADTVPDSWVGQGAEGEVLKARIQGLLSEGKVEEAEAVGRDARASASASGLNVANAAGLADITRARTGREVDADVAERDMKGNKRVEVDVEVEGDEEDSNANAKGERVLRDRQLHETPLDGSNSREEAQPPSQGYSNSSQPITPSMRTSSLPGAGSTGSSKVNPSVHFRVVPQARTRPQMTLPNGLPKVFSQAELAALKNPPAFRFVDAQAVNQTGNSRGPSTVNDDSTTAQGSSGVGVGVDDDPQMAAFQDMLTEYLKLEKEAEAQEAATAALVPEEYVYDLYYRDNREQGITTGAGEVGALIGFDDLSPPSSPSDSEPEDEADEDSNEEDFYRNDYPEDEDADEDMEGFEDAFASDEEGYGGGGDDDSDEGEGLGGSGGKWDYRD